MQLIVLYLKPKNPEIALIVLHVHVKVTYNIVILYFEGGECVEISH